MMEASKNKILSCALAPPELQKRKADVMAELKKQLLQKKELPNGFTYCFPGSDALLDQLTAFIKSERACCPFFTFTLVINDAKSETCLEMTGPEGVKDFITTELDF